GVGSFHIRSSQFVRTYRAAILENHFRGPVRHTRRGNPLAVEPRGSDARRPGGGCDYSGSEPEPSFAPSGLDGRARDQEAIVEHSQAPDLAQASFSDNG